MPPGSGTRWLGPWLGTTAVATVVATLFDAALLQRGRSYFTGGFLAVDYLADWGQTAAFFAGSLAEDMAVVGVFALVSLWAAGRLGLSKGAGMIAATLVAVAPVIGADVVAYQLQTLLGDAFDIALMFQLVGRSPAEIAAVSSAHITTVVASMVAAAVALAGSAWALRRLMSKGAALALPTGWQALRSLACLWIVGLVVATGLRASSSVLDNGLRRKPTGQLLGFVVDVVSDVDRDGYGLLGRLRDSAPFDAGVHPYAIDVPGNGVDEDEVGGDLPAGLPPYIEPADDGPGWVASPPLVLVALESFRADAFGAVLKGRPVTPVLDALAASGVASAHAYSHNGYTVQSRRHFFSGSLAGVRGRATLVDDFNAHGYETAYFSGQDDSFGGPEADVGLARASVSYDARDDQDKRYTTFSTAGSLAVPYNVLTERVASFLKTRQRVRPLFLYVNFHDTHFPYHHAGIRPLLDGPVVAQADIVPARAADLRAMYLNTAANVDAAIGDVLRLVRATVGREPAVIVLADHGESLFDEGFLGHGYALNEAQTRIPLIVSGLPAKVVEPFGQTDLRDIIRTALTRNAPGDRPVVEQDDARRVFQYLGSIESPAQVALTGLSGRVTYDFRSRRVQVGDARWRREDELTRDEAQPFQELIHQWERMMLARAADGHGPKKAD